MKYGVLQRLIHQPLKYVTLLSFVGMEEYNLRVFNVVTYSPVGALPLGMFITSDETTDTITRALTMFKACLNDKAFYGCGSQVGPAVIMTDNCSELRDALKLNWAEAILLLCIFHLMQQLWKWLFERSHGINSVDRPNILTSFKRVLYAREIDDMEHQYDEMVKEDIVKRYSSLIDYLATLYDIRESWALC